MGLWQAFKNVASGKHSSAAQYQRSVQLEGLAQRNLEMSFMMTNTYEAQSDAEKAMLRMLYAPLKDRYLKLVLECEDVTELNQASQSHMDEASRCKESGDTRAAYLHMLLATGLNARWLALQGCEEKGLMSLAGIGEICGDLKRDAQ